MSRKLLHRLLLQALLVGLIAFPLAASAQALLSQGKPAVASSVEGALTAAGAVDGNAGTRWGSAFSDPQWIYVDLGAPATITKVVLSWEAAYGKAYQLQTASDPAGTWTTIYSTTAGAGGTETLNVSGTGRYVRMYGTARGTGYGYSLWEFQVYGTPVVTATLLSQGQPSASSCDEAGLGPAGGFDGNTGTRWSSCFSDPQWIYVDLGATSTISKVVLSWEAAYGKAYQLQVADSPTGTWTPIYSTTAGAGGTETLNVSGTGRYVRMYGTARATAYGYSLWEFQVYGTRGGLTCATLPGAPAGLAASSVTSTGLTLSWTAPAAGANCTISGYNVYRGGTLVGTFTGTSAAITGLTASTAYSFTVAAVNASGTGPQSAALPITTSGATCAAVPAAPTGLTASNVTSTSVILAWTAPAAGASCTISGYRVYQNGTQAATPAGTGVSISGLAGSTTYSYTVAAVNEVGVGPQSAALAVSTNGSATNPNFGSNVTVFDSTMSAATIQSQINAIYATQQNNQFGTPRTAILFKPGTYAVDLPVGFYTQVVGLGALPTQVSVSNVHSDAYMANGNATQNFWRGLENFSVTAPPGAGMQWAVSQACPFRRMSVPNNNIILFQASGSQNWASGGWMSDSVIRYDVTSGSQQQWISRNSQWGSWTGSVWNMVFVGIPTGILPGGTWPATPNTFVNPTPVVAEKPFLWLNGASYEVFVPALRTNVNGVSWSSTTQSAGTSVPLDQFYVAHPGDTAAVVNAALSQGKHLLLTPGVYDLTAPIQVTRAGTVVMGMGFATLHPTAGNAALTVADVDGVRVSHLLVDAGATNSPVLVQVGPAGSTASHASNPTLIQDVFARVGGAGNGSATVAMQVNSNDVIIDHIWLWRADHGAGAGWTTNPSANGLVVNGQNVIAYGLFVEHFQQYQVLWNGNGGRTYFYQSEIPYDPPDQASWSAPGVLGWPSYKVANTVTSHQAYGMGIYSVFTNANVYLSNAIECPSALPAGSFQHLITVNLTANGGINNVIDNTGGATPPGIAVGTPKVTSYP
jgi:chitodextrinase